MKIDFGKGKKPNLEQEILQINALVSFYFKDDPKKDLFLDKAIDNLYENYNHFMGTMSIVEIKRTCLENTSRKLLEEANIYYQNKRK